jgi:hypothetical protein
MTLGRNYSVASFSMICIPEPLVNGSNTMACHSASPAIVCAGHLVPLNPVQSCKSRSAGLSCGLEGCCLYAFGP